MDRSERWGVWCVVSGGVTGYREAWMRAGQPSARFEGTREEAEAEAAKYNQSMNASPYRTANFRYTARIL